MTLPERRRKEGKARQMTWGNHVVEENEEVGGSKTAILMTREGSQDEYVQRMEADMVQQCSVRCEGVRKLSQTEKHEERAPIPRMLHMMMGKDDYGVGGRTARGGEQL